MKRFLTSVLILSSLLLITQSCGSLRRQGYKKEATVHRILKPVFPPDFDKSLYNVKITFGKNVFTSLGIIKYIAASGSYKLALLSEAGMRLFEVEFLNDGSSKVNYTSDFMNKKSVVKKLSSDFRLLFPGEASTAVKYFAKDENYVLRIKENGLKDYYFLKEVTGPVKIRQRGCTFGRTTVILDNYGNKGPQEIVFKHKMIKFEISFKQIDYNGWN